MVRVRFAPSPTGYLHIGNARAALINYLYALRYGGDFILRIDDTDLERSKPEYEKAIYQDFEWLGVKYSETFRQSERFERYHQIKEELIKNGKLYPCYETTEELDFKRKRQLAKGQPPIYDRSSLLLTDLEKDAFEKDGRKPHWRFKLDHEPIVWQDIIRGEVKYNGAQLSDPVLIRADGVFLYSLCSVIDDIDYSISHIIRGEDHVTNTATQIQLFKAVNDGKDFPVTFAHTTLLMDEDGAPLSKRLGSLSLGQMRDSGVEPMAIACLLARLGTSLPIEPLLTLNELASSFDLSTFSRTPPRFSEKDLWALNHKLYHLMPFSQIQERLKTNGFEKFSENHWRAVHDNIEKIEDLEPWESIFFGKIRGTCSDNDFLKIALDLLPAGSWAEETWGIWTQSIKEKTGRKGKDLFMPLRQALTAMDHGPEMKMLLPLIGSDKVKERLCAT
ncbi:MAG: glutamate--tRNA ligase [Pseudomonadota bacterium]|jgi:glutamyl-tRNA synthetase|nr:glutamate--tRNA ligase [Alphaproteobacteria bacterium]